MVCSDLRRALPLLRHNAKLNGGKPTKEPAKAAAAPEVGGGCGFVLCPRLHALSEQVPVQASTHLLTRWRMRSLAYEVLTHLLTYSPTHLLTYTYYLLTY